MSSTDLTAGVQELLVLLLCHDDGPRGAKLVRTLVEPKVFDPYYREIATAAWIYHDQYEKVPGEHTLDLIQSLQARHPDSEEIYARIFQSLEATKASPQFNAEYAIARAKLFARSQHLKVCAAQLLDNLELESEEGIVAAEAVLEKARKRTHDLFYPGLFLTDTSRSLAFLDSQEEVFPIGVKEFDDVDLCLARKRLLVLMGLYGKGKTHFLVGAGKRALLNRAKVCHVSLELTEEEVSQRYLQALFSVTKRPEEIEYQEFATDELGRFLSMSGVKVGSRPSLRDDDIRTQLTSKIASSTRILDRLVIRQFPTGELTVPMLESYLDGLEASHGFLPDVLLVDYPDLMKVDPRYEREELSQIYKSLRGIAIRKNIAVGAVTQSNREGEGAKTLGGRQVSGDFSKLATADVWISYNQTDEEHELGLARLYAGKGRTDRDRFTVLISQAYALGQFCVGSAKMESKKYWASVKEEAGEAEEAVEE